MISPLIENPFDEGTPEHDQVKTLNSTLLENSIKLAKFDPAAGRWRFAILIGVAIVTVVGSLALVATGGGLEKTIAAGAVVVSGLLVAGLMNPLQTIERDIVFRRWSDVIMHTYLIQAADPNLPAPRLKALGEAASAQFASLAGAYAGVANKSLETLQIISKPTADGNEADSDANSLSVTNPGDQPGEKGKPIHPALQIVAKGKDRTYRAVGLPKGLTLDDLGEISGTPTEAKESRVKVTVSNSAAEAAINFKWNVTEPKAGSSDAGERGADAVSSATRAGGERGSTDGADRKETPQR